MKRSIPILRVLILLEREQPALQETLGQISFDHALALDCREVRARAEVLSACAERPWDLLLVEDALRARLSLSADDLLRDLEPCVPVVVLAQSSWDATESEPPPPGFFDRVTLPHLGRLRPSLQAAAHLATYRAQRDRREAGLRRSSTMLHAVLGAAPISIFTTDEHGVFTLHQGNALKRVGMVAGQNVGESSYTLFGNLPIQVGPDTPPPAREVISRVLAGETIRGQTQLGEVSFDNQFEPLRDETGRITGLVGVACDITDRKRTEQELRRSEQELRAMSQRLAAVEEQERQRISRDLHDTVGQALSAAGISLTLLARELGPKISEAARDRLDDTTAMVEDISRSLREVIANLRPPMLTHFGLRATLQWLAERCAKPTGLAITVQGAGPSSEPPPSVALAFTRIAQEALNNVVKHAQATTAQIALEDGPDGLALVVTDNGVGYSREAQASAPGSWGLTIMRDRAAAVGATFSLESTPGIGTTVRVTWTRPREPEELAS